MLRYPLLDQETACLLRFVPLIPGVGVQSAAPRLAVGRRAADGASSADHDLSSVIAALHQSSPAAITIAAAVISSDSMSTSLAITPPSISARRESETLVLSSRRRYIGSRAQGSWRRWLRIALASHRRLAHLVVRLPAGPNVDVASARCATGHDGECRHYEHEPRQRSQQATTLTLRFGASPGGLPSNVASRSASRRSFTTYRRASSASQTSTCQ